MKKIILVLLTVTILSGAANSRLSCNPETSFPYEWMATSSAVGQASYLSAHGYTGVSWNVYQCGAGYCATVCGNSPGGGL